MPRLTPLPAGLRFRDGTARFEVVVPKTDGRVRRRKTVPAADLRDALERFEGFKREVLGAIAAKPAASATTFGAYIEQHLPAVCGRVSPKTATSYRQFVTNHLLPYFGDLPLNDITMANVRDFQGHLRAYRSTHPRWRGQPLSAASINGCLRVLRLLLRDAYTRRLLTEVPRGDWPGERENVLRLEATDDERRQFLAAFDDEPAFQRLVAGVRESRPEPTAGERRGKTRTYGGGRKPDGDGTAASFARFHALKPLFVVAFESGLRRGDLLRLQKSSVHLDHGFIRVTMQKTGLEAVIAISSACRAALATAQAASGTSEYVFTEPGGSPVSETTFTRAFATAKALAGITRRFRPHDARHTFASRLASKGVSLQVIARALGHASTALTERYAKPDEAALKEVAGALAEDE